MACRSATTTAVLLPLLMAAGAGGAASPGEPGAAAVPPASSARRTPVVEVVQAVGPAVVNIATDQRVVNPFANHPFGGLLQEFFEGGGRTQRQYVQNSLGSGVMVRPDGYLVTNEHVIWGASRIRVTFQDGRTVLAEVVGTDGDSDLAVLKVEGEGPFPSVQMGRSDELLIGETVIAIGNPYGFSSSVTTGVVSALGRSVETGDRVFTDFIQTDALINPGNSGGPLLDIEGNLIGVNNAVYAPAQGIGFAIPVDRVRHVVNDIIHYGEVRHAWFGFLVEEYALEEGPGDGVSSPRGVRVRALFTDSPADAAGLMPGDRIVRMDGRPVQSRNDVETIFSHLGAGTPVRVEVERGPERRALTLQGESFPEEKAEDYFAEITGLVLEPIPESLRQRYRHLPDEGLIVTEVRGGSRAARLGLNAGDVIVRLGREPVKDLAALRRLVPQLITRSDFFMVVVRGRAAYNLTFRLS